ncbi:response regulator [Geomonas sp. Red32]|uniref:response regulator n=1 Tax=Geomonas sp. Red32 TaxID=2912856 RepID=UPI00202CE91B|nr:response regulator [Geomonas sp. Red32]MCM0083289.1 response regulator [Geomonas sp. Red32]
MTGNRGAEVSTQATILVVEDSLTQAAMLERLLTERGYRVEVARNGREGLEKAFASIPDLVVSDIVMPLMTGFELCKEIKNAPRLKETPVILLTSLNDPTDVIRGLQCKADHFLTKPYDEEVLLGRIRQVLRARREQVEDDPRLGTPVEFAGGKFHIDAERKQILGLLLSTYETAVEKNAALLTSQQSLRELNEQLEERIQARTASLLQEVEERTKAEERLGEVTRRLQLAADSAHLGIWDLDVAADRLIWDERMYQLFGGNPGDTVGISYWRERLHPADRDQVMKAFDDALAGSREYDLEYRVLQADGTLRWIKANGTVIRGEGGEAVRMIGVCQDISARKNLEDQLRQAQKMEAVGQFAGGIAHDFNNILTAIVGFASMAQLKMREDDPLRPFLDQVLSAADRAAGLTQSLLTFSRKQPINLSPVNLNDLIKKVEKFLGRIIGEDIKLMMVFKEDEIVVQADGGQIEQVLLNLATNVRDALPHGGTLSIVTETVDIDQEYVDFYRSGSPGRYARISVSDNGIGMDAETKKRIFEPFYTTKQVGKGTGLGLSIVYGIVQQHKGFINVYSEVGRGTTFSIYLPLAVGVQLPKPGQGELAPPVGGDETILLAEDDAVVRELSRTVLADFGYRVIEASNGEEAVEKFREHRDEIGLLLFDIVMPKKNGKEAFDEIRSLSPHVKALFLSGYPAEIISNTGLIEEGASLIMKPVHPQDLLRRIRRALDEPDREGGDR